MGHHFVPSIANLTEPISADLSGRLIEQLVGYPTLIELVHLAGSPDELSEYNRRVVDLLVTWKAALRNAWKDFERQRGETAGMVHGDNATVSAIISAGGAHMLELRAAPEGTRDVDRLLDLRFYPAARTAAAGLVMAMCVGTRIMTGPTSEAEVALSVLNALMQNSHTDGDYHSQFINHLMNISPEETRSEKHVTLCAKVCGLGGAKTRPPDMTLREREQLAGLMDREQLQAGYVRVSEGHEAQYDSAVVFVAGHFHHGPGFVENGSMSEPLPPDHDHRQPGYKMPEVPVRIPGELPGRFRMALFIAGYDEGPNTARDNGRTFTDTSVRYALFVRELQNTAKYRKSLRTTGAWIDHLVEVEPTLQMRKSPRLGDVVEHNAALPMMPKRAGITKAVKELSNQAFRAAGDDMAYESRALFRVDLPRGYMKRVRLVAGNVIVSPNRTPGDRTDRTAAWLRWDWPASTIQHLLTTLGGDAVPPEISHDVENVVLTIPASSEKSARTWVGDIYPPCHTRVPDDWSDALVNYTCFNGGPAASYTINAPAFPADVGGRRQGEMLQYRLLNEGCGFLARAVPCLEATTRYHVWYHVQGVNDPPIPPLICLFLRKEACKFDEITRPMRLDCVTTTYEKHAAPHV
jgi:hypothetical protein